VEVLALSLTVLVHFVGLGALVLVIVHNDGIDWRSWWPRDDRGDGPDEPPPPDGPGPLPLADAGPGRARLREPGRLADAYPPPPRRPQHVPAPDPDRERI
jgi:hypothetical protein